MAKQQKARAGLTGGAVIAFDFSVRQASELTLAGSSLLVIDPLVATLPLAITILEMESDVSATRWERPLTGPLDGTLSHYESIHGAGFLFDNRGETPTGIIVRDNGEIVKFQTRDLGFSGSDKSVSTDDNGVDVRIPALKFEPTINVRFNSAPFTNQTIAEKGYASPSLKIGWASNDPSDVPIIEADQLSLNGIAISLDSGDTITGGGTYSPSTPITEEVEGTGISVRLHSAFSTVTRSAGLTWLPRVYHGSQSLAALTEPDILALANSNLAGSRNSTRVFAAAPDTYKWICYPTSFGAARPLDDFLDADTNLKVPMEEPSIVEVTNAYGFKTPYFAYRTTNKVAGAINVKVV